MPRSFFVKGIILKQLKVALVSLGCPKNLVDAEIMLGHLPDDRYTITTDESLADIIIVNTCSFISDAREESVDTILSVADYKISGHCSLLIVSGCLPQRYRDELSKELPEVDLFVGTGDAGRLATLIEQCLVDKTPLTDIGKGDFLYDHTTPRLRSSPFYSTYVKIAEGCSNHCSYCVIPEIRGALRSREIASIVDEVRALTRAGVKEINLIAQDITAFRRDFGETGALEKLLRELVQIEELAWLRLLYAYPDNISDELLELMATEDKICAYLDIPLQHFADDILAQMNRRVDQAAIRKLIARIKQAVPDITLRTSFIVGFPGETDDHFRQLLDFVKEGHLERVGVFRYSREDGTPAAEFADQITDTVKNRRYHQLMKAQGRISFRKNRALINRVEPVLIEGLSDETDLLLQGRSIRQAPDIDGKVYVTAGNAEVGQIVNLRIIDSSEYDLVGEIVEA